MIYHELGTSGIRISSLAFGAMRWQNEADCRAIMERGMDAGLNYVDTSTGYVGGQSQVWVANAIRERRDDILFSTKTGYGQAHKAKEFVASLAARLKKLRLDHADMVQVWGIETMATLEAALAKDGTVAGARQAQKDGLVRHGIGFTFHGPPEVFKAAVDSGEFLSATVSYSLLNREAEPLLAYAAERGVGILIMNPLAGGMLALAERQDYAFLRGPDSGPVYGSLRFLLANPNISAALVGYRVPAELDESLRALDTPDDLAEPLRRDLIKRIEGVARPDGRFCTGCGYCKECPEGFKPPKFMKTMRDFALYAGDEERLVPWLISRYETRQTVADALARCVECGKCEDVCPQKLPIISEIRRAKAALDAK